MPASPTGRHLLRLTQVALSYPPGLITGMHFSPGAAPARPCRHCRHFGGMLYGDAAAACTAPSSARVRAMPSNGCARSGPTTRRGRQPRGRSQGSVVDGLVRGRPEVEHGGPQAQRPWAAMSHNDNSPSIDAAKARATGALTCPPRPMQPIASFGELMPASSTLKKPLLGVALATALLLLVPAIAMLYTSEVAWGSGDFVVAGVLLFGAGAAAVMGLRHVRGTGRRTGLIFVIAFCLALVWAELAVGLFS